MPSYENAARKARPCIAPASLLALGARASRPRQAAEERMEQRMSGGNGHGHCMASVSSMVPVSSARRVSTVAQSEVGERTEARWSS